MTDEQLALFRKALLDKLRLLIGDSELLEKEIFRSKKDSATLDISKFADLGTDNYEIEFDMELLESQGEEMREVVEALKRIDSGGFGVCGSCGKKIQTTRLKAIPYAKLCVQCKKAEEENGGAGF